MKKFTQICLITSLILIMIGGTVCVVGGISGGWKLVKEMENGDSWRKVAQRYSEGLRINGKYFTWDEMDEELEAEIEEEIEAVESWAESDGDRSAGKSEIEDIRLEKIKDLEINIGGAALYVREAENGRLAFSVDGKGEYRCYESDGVLYVEGGKNKNVVMGEEKVYLYLPSDLQFENVSVNVGGGSIELGKMVADEMEFAIGAGEIKADRISSKTLSLEVGAGTANLKHIEIGELNAEVGIGDCVIQGNITKDIDIECGMGNVELELAGDQEDYNYDISCAAGVIEIGNKSYSALADDMYIDNDADVECSLECAMGNIEITYE